MTPETHITFRTAIAWAGLVGIVVAIGSCMTAPSRFDIPEIECIGCRVGVHAPP